MYIKVHVYPESKLEFFKKTDADTFAVAVREKAKAGAANSRVLAVLRKHFPAARVYIVSGHQSPHKIVSVE